MALSAKSLAEIRFEGREKRPSTLATTARWNSRVAELECATLPDAELRLVEAVFGRSGLAASDYRPRPLQRRIQSALRCIRASGLDECAQAVSRDELTAHKMLSALLIGHTMPFRDEPVFRQLADTVFTSLLANQQAALSKPSPPGSAALSIPSPPGRGQGEGSLILNDSPNLQLSPERRGNVLKPSPGLRIWSAGCSNGMELYSAALIMASLGRFEQSTLLGTDTRPKAIAEAKSQARAFWSLVPESFADLKAKISEERFLTLSQQIMWRVENVFSFAEDGRFDVVFCRNLAIYLRQAAACKLWEIIARALVPAGVLVVGKAEKPLPADRWQRISACVYRVVKP